MEHQTRSLKSLLRQALSQDKRPLGLFLGAGCPASIIVERNGDSVPLIPSISGLSQQLAEAIAKTDLAEAFQQAITNLQADGTTSPNIEDVLTHIRSLQAIAGKETVRGFTAEMLHSLEDRLGNDIVSIVDRSLPPGKSPFHSVATWIDSRPRTLAVQVFTTNYDLLIEQAMEERRVAYFDGFIGSHRAFFDPYAMDNDALPPRWARLWKLHGSINWVEDEDEQHVQRVSLSEKPGKRRVIHPSHLKYDESRRMPFLAMADRLRAFFAQKSAALVTCGFSFKDEHINEDLEQGLRGNPDSVLFALVHGPMENYPAARTIATRQPNFTLMSEDSAVFSGRYGAWWTEEAETPSEEDDAGAAREDDESKNDSMTLGDFNDFGVFLDELVGATEVEQVADPAQ